MGTKKILLGIMAATTMLTSCLNDDGNYRAGFVVESPTNSISAYYANNTSDSLIFFSYGNWKISNLSGYDNSWISVPVQTGKGSAIYGQVISFEQNTTNQSRTAAIKIEDTSHSDEAHVSLAFIQYATRGYGAYGSAADVKSITGSDGSEITFAYDEQHRPTSVKTVKDGQTLSSLQITYGATQMTVKDNFSGSFTADCDRSYQPNMLRNGGDTIGYFPRYYENYVEAPANYTFKFEHRGLAGYTCVTYQFPYNKYSLAPDSIHNADSLFYYKNYKKTLELGVTFSQQDNRYQSVDANQLLLGVDECDPYLLASLFRYTRNTNIIAEAKNDKEKITVSATINANKSINQLTVKRESETVVYTFNY